MTTSDSVRTCPFRHDEALEPDPFMTRMRTEAPVTRVLMPYGKGDCWLVTRYADVQTVTSDRRFSRAALIGQDFPRITPAPIAQSEAINLMDPPALNRVRKLIIKAFTTPKVEALRPWTQRTTDALLDEMAEHGSPADVAEHLAGRIPLMTISELLDVPEADRPQLRRWAMAMMSMSVADKESAAEAKAGLRGYFDELTAERRRNPGEDLISALATARIGDEALEPAELSVLAMLLVVTGHDTTTYDISNIVYTLLTYPDHLAQLRARPELLPRAIEELLRYIPFRQGVGIPRVALEDVDFDGVTVKAGDTVHVSYLTANRDELAYERPDDLDFERAEPLPHMAFGYGSHHCLGSHLARMVLQVSIGSLLHRFPELRLAVPVEEVRWNTNSIWRYPLTLPVAW
ncbi:cytochrome P450 [Streptomyces albireticuli]|uniref:Cytochrome n=1 Tax=Streptomyces albireticuli TaxID=1940 RepID=A0A2A2DGB0_9ACTN|nr:cytochrome P450 [Streptomyces albireticuli]MCD9145226.1 cytochrome P450 [Streptomyces albireticuli]MCD9164599.1 cytochrome P450 [Streptomyces albireticuli]MCD9194864.1 cytochrome P450 [Streptomyces albireticuli]PAU50506.1 cytochrome [Streptomyces albireticuli]